MFCPGKFPNDTSLLFADSTGVQWKTETDNLYDDSSAFGNILTATVHIVDRGRTEYVGADRWRKVKIVEATSSFYRIQYCLYNNSLLSEIIIQKK